jgi:hypothetical protein
MPADGATSPHPRRIDPPFCARVCFDDRRIIDTPCE